MFLPGGSLSLVPCFFQAGLCLGVSFPPNQKSGRYTSFWNAFLLIIMFMSIILDYEITGSGIITPPSPVDRQTGVKTLPCPKLCLRAVKIGKCHNQQEHHWILVTLSIPEHFMSAMADPMGGGESLYDVTSCLAAWSDVPSRGSLSLVPCSSQGVSIPGPMFLPGGLCGEGGLFPPIRKAGGTHLSGMLSC